MMTNGNVSDGDVVSRVKVRAVGVILVALSVAGSVRAVPPFDGKRAKVWVERQVAHGPRIPGTAAHQACLADLERELRALAADVRRHEAQRRGIHLTNLVATFRPEAAERVFLMAHWDTRPWADEDPDPAQRRTGVPGANDGASGVAVLLEVARALAVESAPRGVDLFLVDAEDGGSHQDPTSWCLGSQSLAEELATYRPKLGILLDMVGDANLRLPMEANSLRFAGVQTRWLWALASSRGEKAFVAEVGPAVTDDHIAFLQRGIPTIDVIDFTYPYWHTTADTPDKVSAESLAIVGRVVLEAVYAPRLPW
jgi:hypothetical protein